MRLSRLYQLYAKRMVPSKIRKQTMPTGYSHDATHQVHEIIFCQGFVISFKLSLKVLFYVTIRSLLEGTLTVSVLPLQIQYLIT